MRLALACVTLAVIAATFGLVKAHSSDVDSSKPQYAGDTLVRPDGYREWIYLSSGLGMSYNPSAMGSELFTNVFVAPWAYREFVATGKWHQQDRTFSNRPRRNWRRGEGLVSVPRQVGILRFRAR